jgi:hypothetical protein
MEIEHAIMAGESLYGKAHGVLVPVHQGKLLMPRRAKRPLCGGRRVMVNGQTFVPNHPQSCALCSAMYPKEST